MFPTRPPHFWLLAAILVTLAPHLAWAAGLPTFLGAPKGLAPTGDVIYEDYGEADIARAKGEPELQVGHHWYADLQLSDVAEDIDSKQLWPRLAASMRAAGWVAEVFDSNPPHVALRLATKERKAWADLWLFGARDLRLHLIEAAPQTLKHTFAQPGAKAEDLSDVNKPIPYLAPLAGSGFESGGTEPTAMEVTPPGGQETVLVGTRTILRRYTVASTLSNLQFVEVIRTALVAAGWQIVEAVHGTHKADAQVVAHYAQRGRDLWLVAHHGAGEYTYALADAGDRDLGAELKQSCRATLTGLFFDFDKATLRPESDGALQRAQAALKQNPTLDLEIQGHTDGKGTDAYNDKLSHERADAVLKWLTSHGVSADHLSAEGYGKRVPVASNATDAGRAKNRRVELVCKKGAAPRPPVEDANPEE